MNRSLAKIISFIFNPLLMPTLLLAGFYFFAPVIVNMAGLSIKWRFGILGFVNFYTFVLPLVMIYFMYRRKWVQTLTLRNLRERRWPYLITTIFYLFLSYFMFIKNANFYHTSVLIFFSAVVIIIVAVVSLWWQISAHSAAISGTFGAFFVTYFKYGETNLFYAMLISLLLCGAVMTARLRLNAHSLSQVIAGFAVGFVVSWAGYWLL